MQLANKYDQSMLHIFRMTQKFVEQQKWPVTIEPKITFIAAKTLRDASVYHHAQLLPMTHTHHRLISILPTLYRNRIIIKISIWKSKKSNLEFEAFAV